jgi:hypothetical protein
MIPPRFVRAVNSTRRYGTHRYDLFGPKVGRRLTLFGQFALDQWVRLESDPHVVTYCERPLRIPDIKPSRLVDFRVRTRDGKIVRRAARCYPLQRPRDVIPMTSMIRRRYARTGSCCCHYLAGTQTLPLASR